jgi:hypothetical protein
VLLFFGTDTIYNVLTRKVKEARLRLAEHKTEGTAYEIQGKPTALCLPTGVGFANSSRYLLTGVT